jgi:hypothetical protein
MGKLNNRQTIPAGGFAPSASGGLHNSSMGTTYPWTIIGVGPEDWAAFNCLTGFTGPARMFYDQAHEDLTMYEGLTPEELGMDVRQAIPLLPKCAECGHYFDDADGTVCQTCQDWTVQ